MFARKEESVAEMIGHVDSARPDERISLCIEIARKQLAAVGESEKAGNTEQAHTALSSLLTYAGKAFETSLQANRKLKDTEIALRKIAEKLRDLKRGADFEQQAPLQDASDRLETMRTQLLARMFAKKEK